MSGRELQDYLMESGLFKVIDTCIDKIGSDRWNDYMIDSDDYYIPRKYKGFSRVDIEIVKYKYGEQEQWVEFTFGGINLFACHKLKDLDFRTLYKELNKIYGLYPKFIEWSKIELRNYNIEQLL